MDYRNTTEIKANPKNPRVIKDEKFAKLVQSLKDFPEMLEKRPLVCFTDTDKKLVVLGGNMRLKAANELGLKKMPVILADDWTEEQKAQFLIKDNVSFGEWDYDSLANEWDVEQLEDWGLNIPNYDTTIDDIEEVDQFNESVSFTIKCDSITQLEQLQTKLNTSANKLSFEDFLIKAGL